ncbi:GNAT family N-acetyltransferase [Nonomuraea dietziae]|uniref:GNAT family N-acetyltransferase n=1 Tax=Nonomuraea dietziae TaxID=65515 RepID=UPI0031DEA492
MTTYRAATPADEPGLHALWAVCFAAPQLLPLYRSDPDRLPRTMVAEGSDGVEAVVYWLPRRVRNAEGGIDLVGGVANVATRPDARGRGHIRSLLGMALESMSEAGCDWSLLFTGSPGVYESSGYKVFSQSLTRGPLAAATRDTSGVRRASVAEWPLLAELYDRHNAHRPLTTVRSRRTGPQGAGPLHDSFDLRLAEGSRELRGPARHDPHRWRCWMAVAPVPSWFPSCFVVPPEASRPPGACRVTRAEARLTPGEPALPFLFAELETVADTSGMARPLAVDPSPTLASPSAIHWVADYF